jgi:predicted transcriptional regulator
MSTVREPDLSEEEERILSLLDDEALRIEDISQRAEIDFEKARDTVQHLWDQNLVVSGPDFEFEADRGVPPNLQ